MIRAKLDKTKIAPNRLNQVLVVIFTLLSSSIRSSRFHSITMCLSGTNDKGPPAYRTLLIFLPTQKTGNWEANIRSSSSSLPLVSLQEFLIEIYHIGVFLDMMCHPVSWHLQISCLYFSHLKYLKCLLRIQEFQFLYLLVEFMVVQVQGSI